jgi:hypothetical protein
MELGSYYHFFRGTLGISSVPALRQPVTFLPMHPEPNAIATPSDALSKRVMAIMISGTRPPEGLWDALAGRFGALDFKGTFASFDATGYYRDEFGEGLHRGFVSFGGLFDPGELPAFKREAAALEAAWSRDGRRSCNLDAGYLDPDKLVLASYKRGPGKLYLRDGIYADMQLKYAKGLFEPLPWAFPDLRDGRYNKGLLAIREKLKSELRKYRDAFPGKESGTP